MIGRRTLKIAILSTTTLALSSLCQPIQRAIAADATSQPTPASPAAAGAPTATLPTASASAGVDDGAIRSRISALTKALALGDEKAVALLWAPDGCYTDESGEEWKGRAALEKRFATVFAEQGRQLVNLAPDTVRRISDNVVLVEGVVQRKQESTEITPTTRFSLLLVKQDGSWLVSMATETPLNEQPSSDHLQSLAWLIGDWQTVRDGKTVTMHSEWVANNNFIHSKFVTEAPDEPKKTEIQIIGWDPRSEQIVSWNFDSNGGFGYGKWINRGGKWFIDAMGVSHDGSTSRATNIISAGAQNTFSWQSVERSIDGVAVADTAPVKVDRAVR